MKKTKTQKGITLIALIITIVVLLILAVVAIGAVRNGGIITHAQNTKLIYQVAQIEEAFKLKMQEEKLAIAAGELVVGTEGDINSYHSWVDSVKLMAAEMPSVSYGNVYSDIEPNKGELIGENLLWLVTDCISGKGMFEMEGVELPFEALGINTSLGQNGYFEDVQDMETGDLKALGNKDIFFFDEAYNMYYVDKEGNVITSKGIYKVSEIYVGSEYFDPEVSLTPAEKAIYDGIYEGAYAFSKDPIYAEKLATADFLITEDDLAAFFFGGYSQISFTDADGNILEVNGVKLEGMAAVRRNPDGTTIANSNNVMYCMDSNYNMYKVDMENNTIEDKDGNLLQVDTDIKSIESVSPKVPEGVSIPEGYTVTWRFDGKGIIIEDVPDKLELDIAEDFANFDYEIYAMKFRLFADKTTQRLTLPNKMKKLSNFDTSFESGYESGIELLLGAFEQCKNLTYIKLPNDMKYIYADDFKNCTKLREVIMPDNIQRIGENAFYGCSSITLRFKDGVAPAGAPWGASSSAMTITSK